MFKKFVFRVLVISLFSYSFVFANKTLNKTIENITSISSTYLYNYDTVSMETILNQYIKQNQYIHGLKIIDNSDNTIFYQIYKKDTKITKDKNILNSIENLITLKKEIIYNSKIIGQLIVYGVEKGTISFSKEEKIWLKKHSVINFVADLDYRPFEFIDKKGNYSGIASSYLELISLKTGLTFKQTKVENWTDGVKKIENRESDMFTCAKVTKKRLEVLNFTKPYLEYSMVMITKTDKQFLDGIKSLYGKKVVGIKGYAITELIANKHPKIKLIYVDNTTQALQAVSDGKAYSFISDLPAASYYINKQGFFDLKIAGKLEKKSKLAISIRNDWDDIGIQIINKALDSITQQEKDRIYNKWVSITFNKTVDYSVIWKILIVVFILFLAILFWVKKLSNLNENLRNMQQELEIQTQKAILSSKSKSEFLANMSHEIRTPMNAVIGFADLLTKMIKDPIQKDYLNSIQTGGKALLIIINDILDLSKIESGKFEIEKESTNPIALFKEMQTIFNVKIDQYGLLFILDVDKNLPDSIVIDTVRVRQVLINLIGNAIKFTKMGTVTLKIESIFKNKIRTKLDLKISVIDTGRGIKKEFHKKIFGAFEQTSVDDAKTFAGTGLGLAICSKLTKLMGGTIEVHSVVEEGSTFIVILKDVDVGSLNVDLENENIDTSYIYFNKAKILVVDDIDANRKLIFAALQDSNLEIIEAKNGLEAVDIVSQNNDIDLILMDLRMPVMNGYKAITTIREDETKKGIPIIAYTASAVGKDVEKIEQYGFNGYLRKPIIYSDLVQELMKHLKYEKQTNSSEDNDNIILNKEILKNIPKVLKQLDGEFKKELERIKDKGNFTIIKELILKIKKLGKDNSLLIIEDYSQKLLNAIDSFDIATVVSLINNYNTMVDKVKKLQNQKESVK